MRDRVEFLVDNLLVRIVGTVQGTWNSLSVTVVRANAANAS